MEKPEEQILESHTEILKPVTISGIRSNDNIYEFEERKKIDMVRQLFLKNRRRINPLYRNCLSNANDKVIGYGDVVVYETKDYRVVGIKEDCLVIKNSKRIITVPIDMVNIKIKDLDATNALFVFDLLSGQIERGVFDEAEFFMSFLAVFDVDGIDIYKAMPTEIQEKLKRAIRR